MSALVNDCQLMSADIYRCFSASFSVPRPSLSLDVSRCLSRGPVWCNGACFIGCVFSLLTHQDYWHCLVVRRCGRASLKFDVWFCFLCGPTTGTSLILASSKIKNVLVPRAVLCLMRSCTGSNDVVDWHCYGFRRWMAPLTQLDQPAGRSMVRARVTS